ncbi:MAG: pseudouridine-5'-phosphate glycosidase [Chloroflexi bacterium]|nr:pseudouridine-5'-phosphate glycosidase [Chloroflexota bacterium]
MSDLIHLNIPQDRPVVALESALITHGLPYPHNLETAHRLEALVRVQGVFPATIGVLDGRVIVGCTPAQIERLATAPDVHKISKRDLPLALAQGWTGGTTVAATLWAAARAGISVFATGGIGGVHRGQPFDISADLPELARTPMIVVCAGAKAILDLPLTLEWLETHGVPVIGYQTAEFPAFYSRESGLPVDLSVATPAEVVRVYLSQRELGLSTALLVAAPCPLEAALPRAALEEPIQRALALAAAQGITGRAITPFLLSQVSTITGGQAMQANLALLEHNASIAAQITQALWQG